MIIIRYPVRQTNHPRNILTETIAVGSDKVQGSTLIRATSYVRRIELPTGHVVLAYSRVWLKDIGILDVPGNVERRLLRSRQRTYSSIDQVCIQPVVLDLTKWQEDAAWEHGNHRYLNDDRLARPWVTEWANTGLLAHPFPEDDCYPQFVCAATDISTAEKFAVVFKKDPKYYADLLTKNNPFDKHDPEEPRGKHLHELMPEILDADSDFYKGMGSDTSMSVAHALNSYFKGRAHNGFWRDPQVTEKIKAVVEEFQRRRKAEYEKENQP